MRIEITYKQEFNGRVLTESYIRTVKDHKELIKIENDLFDDPHVISVEMKRVKK